MINLELLQELVAFKKYGTLSATAEHLLITQPSITRGMKKLEEDLGVKLFNRTSNRISLNATGNLAANEAEKVLNQADQFTEKVLNYDQAQKAITIGGVLPDPLMVLQYSNFKLNQKVKINHHLIDPNQVINDLRNYKETLLITTTELDDDQVESMYLGKVRLFLQVDQNSPLARKKQVSFADLAGMSFIVVHEMGPWLDFIQQHIGNVNLLYQSDLSSLVEITQFSRLPMFQTNFTQKVNVRELGQLFPTRTNAHPAIIPITDKSNFIEIYGTYLKASRPIIQPFLKRFAKYLQS